ncbi:MAG: RHS repeat-associated core domain-containing protein [Pseudomonadota bacterium]
MAFLLLCAAQPARALTPQTISGFTPATPIGYSAGANFALSASGGPSGNPVVFTSRTPTVCTVAEHTVSVLRAGTCSLNASQAGDATYSAARTLAANVVISKVSQTLSFGAIPDQSFGNPAIPVVASSSAGLAVRLTSSTLAQCTVSGSTIVLRGAGTCSVTASQAGSINVTPAQALTQSFTVRMGNQTISLATLADRFYGALPFRLYARASSGLPVVYTSVTGDVCSVAANVVTLLKAGACKIAADQPGDSRYNPASQVQLAFVVNQAVQRINFAALTAKTIGAPPFEVLATATSGLPVELASVNPSVCTIAGSTVTLLAPGVCSISANQAGNANIGPAKQLIRSLAVKKVVQTITFEPLAARNLGTGTFKPSASASSGLPVAFSSSTGTICRVATDTSVTLLKVGTCSIIAKQAGSTTYAAAPPVARSFAVGGPLLAQAISGFAPPATIVYSAGGSFALSATGGASGSPVIFGSTTEALCTVSGNIATIVAAGTCKLTANQAADLGYGAAPQVLATVNIQRASQTISFGALANQRIGAAPITLAAGASSALPVSFTSATPTTCSVAGDQLTLVAVGNCSVAADQAGTASVNPAAQVAQSFLIGQAVVALAAGDAHACVLNNAGGVQCWGKNDKGQLGDATLIDRNTPVAVAGLSEGVTAVAAGAEHSCAITVAGAVKCWGGNSAGQLGDGSASVRSGPVTVAGLVSDVVGIAAGGQHSCALLGSGNVKCWGANDQGQLGENSGTGQLAPLAVSGLMADVKSIRAGGTHTCAVGKDGALQCWGRNDEGQLGDGGNATAAFPVTSLTSEVAVVAAASAHTCALNLAGGVVCWGNNANGQLGDGSTGNSVAPVAVQGLNSGIGAIAAGAVSSCALTSAGAVQCWGNNVNTPASMAALPTGIAGIGLGNAYGCAFTGAGATLCWGSNDNGQLGDGSLAARTDPALVSGLSGGNVQNQTISFGSLIDRKINEGAFALGATASSALPVAFGVLTPSVCAVGEQNVTLLGVGYCTIAANQAGDAQYNAAPQMTQSFEVSLVAQAITGFAPDSPIAFQSGAAILLGATGGASGNPVVFASITPGVCTVAGNTATVITAGTCTLTANQQGNAHHSAAQQVDVSVVITQTSQSIVIDTINDKVYGDAAFAVTALGGASGNPVVLATTTPSCAVVGNIVSILGAGICTISASQDGNVDHAAAMPVSTSFIVAQASQIISAAALADIQIGVAPFVLATATSSGLPLTLVSVTPMVCTVDGVTVTVLATGNCAITADQAGNANTSAASQLVISFAVTQASQTIVFGTLPDRVGGETPFTLLANATSGLGVVFSSSTPQVCSVDGVIVTPLAAGTCVIEANQFGSVGYAAAAAVTQSFAITAAVGQVYYVHSDHLNTPRLITDAASNTVWKWESDPFGASAPQESPSGQATFTHNPRFPGQYFDAETGLHYNYFRDYDPSTGRYVKSDPIGISAGPNTYVYVKANPLTLYDPLGLADISTIYCNGATGEKGDYIIINTTVGPAKKCTEIHEQSHLVDWKKRYGAGSCIGKARGFIPYASVNGDNYRDFLRDSECRANEAARKCTDNCGDEQAKKNSDGHRARNSCDKYTSWRNY